jgi:hypothetical protein
MILKISKILISAALLFSASIALAAPQTAAQPAAQSTTPAPAAPTAKAPPKKAPAPKTQAEYDAYKAASAQTEPAKSEAAATDFAQRFPDSELRAFLFQQAMGLYQQANNLDKALDLARATLKYDPNNAVALLTAAQILAERTHDNDLDKNDRLAEASADAENALHHAGDVAQPANMTPAQFAESLAQLRGMAHDVLATVAFNKLDYFTAIREYNLAAAEENGHTDAVIWLRLSIAQDKNGDFAAAMVAVDKALAASEPGTQIRQLAEQEKTRLQKLAASAPPSK